MYYSITPIPFVWYAIQTFYASEDTLHQVMFTEGQDPDALVKASQRWRRVWFCPALAYLNRAATTVATGETWGLRAAL